MMVKNKGIIYKSADCRKPTVKDFMTVQKKAKTGGKS